MRRPPNTKADLLRAMAGHVLTHGLNAASLRPLAHAAQTSDRMLIYHFGSKEALIAELLQYLAEDLATRLSCTLPPGRAISCRACVSDIVALMRRPPLADYMKLWHDIVSAAGQGSASHRQIGEAMIAGFLDWLEQRLPEGVAEPRAIAGLALTMIEGVMVMDAVGQGDVADQALLRLFPA